MTSALFLCRLYFNLKVKMASGFGCVVIGPAGSGKVSNADGVFIPLLVYSLPCVARGGGRSGPHLQSL